MGKGGLGFWKRGLKVGGRLPLAMVEATLNLHLQDVPAPIVLDGGLNVPKALIPVLDVIQEPDNVTPGPLCNRLLHD